MYADVTQDERIDNEMQIVIDMKIVFILDTISKLVNKVKADTNYASFYLNKYEIYLTDIKKRFQRIFEIKLLFLSSESHTKDAFPTT